MLFIGFQYGTTATVCTASFEASQLSTGKLSVSYSEKVPADRFFGNVESNPDPRENLGTALKFHPENHGEAQEGARHGSTRGSFSTGGPPEGNGEAGCSTLSSILGFHKGS